MAVVTLADGSAGVFADVESLVYRKTKRQGALNAAGGHGLAVQLFSVRLDGSLHHFDLVHAQDLIETGATGAIANARPVAASSAAVTTNNCSDRIVVCLGTVRNIGPHLPRDGCGPMG